MLKATAFRQADPPPYSFRAGAEAEEEAETGASRDSDRCSDRCRDSGKYDAYVFGRGGAETASPMDYSTATIFGRGTPSCLLPLSSRFITTIAISMVISRIVIAAPRRPAPHRVSYGGEPHL